MNFKKSLSTLAVPLFLTLSSASFAQSGSECESDADCGDGATCEKESWVNGCDSEAGACDTEVHVAETGVCVDAPTECSTDADCGEYLVCESSDSGTCWASSNGDMGCDAPDPDAKKYCTLAYTECTTNDECPRDFECITGVACPTIDIACAEGEECDPPACEPIGGECVPRQIECNDDSACPADWSCVETFDYACGGGVDGSPPDDSGSSNTEAAAPSPDVPVDEGDAEPVDNCAPVPSVSYCQPDAWGEVFIGGGVDFDSGESGQVTGSDDESDDGDTSSEGDGPPDAAGGCSVDHRRGAPGGAWWVLLLGAPLFFRRRSASRN